MATTFNFDVGRTTVGARQGFHLGPACVSNSWVGVLADMTFTKESQSRLGEAAFAQWANSESNLKLSPSLGHITESELSSDLGESFRGEFI